MTAKTVHPAIAALRAESARIGWPLAFATDLDHDERAINAMLPREPFAWCLYNHGTHMGTAARITDAKDYRRFGGGPIANGLSMRNAAEAFGAENCRFYVWSGNELRPMDTANAADSLLSHIAAGRFCVRTRRHSSLSPAQVATRAEADRIAVEWERRYGEDFVVIDMWEAA